MGSSDWIVIAVVAIAGFALAGACLYWQLVIAEGAYLGKRIVALLYDWYAPRYDRVKQFHPANDAVMLAMPIVRHLAGSRKSKVESRKSDVESRLSTVDCRLPTVLDVATGTGRLPMALLAQPGFGGRVVALDLSARMLAIARQKLAAYENRITWTQHDAQKLPFDDGAFDVVACLESIEFIPNPQAALREMARVLKPRGLLLVSNRIGPDAWKLPGRAMPTPRFANGLRSIGFASISASRWLVDYDLVTAIKQDDMT